MLSGEVFILQHAVRVCLFPELLLTIILYNILSATQCYDDCRSSNAYVYSTQLLYSRVTSPVTTPQVSSQQQESFINSQIRSTHLNITITDTHTHTHTHTHR